MDLVFQAGEIAREAGRVIHSLSQKHDLLIQEKGSSFDFVTEADIASQTHIKECVAKLFPNDRVVGEEDNLSDAEVLRLLNECSKHSRVWLVDPLDGTANFIRGLLGYGVSIAVFEGSETVAGAIYQPDTDDLYLAQPGGGAFCNGNPIRVAQRAKLSETVGATHIPVSNMVWREHSNRWNEAVCRYGQNMRMLGASVYAQTRVAMGGLDYYYEIGPHPWDLAAGRLLIEEAGGCVTRLDGKPFDFGLGGVIASSKAIHSEVVRMLAEADPQLNELCWYPALPDKI